jgi:hypothetical protein
MSEDLSRGAAPSGRLRLAVAAAALAAGLGVLPGGSARAAPKFFTCNPTNVAVFPKSRIHVRCAPGDGSTVFFAFNVANAADDADRLLSLAATAIALKKRLEILYDPSDLKGASFGCLNNDCRVMQGLTMF